MRSAWDKGWRFLKPINELGNCLAWSELSDHRKPSASGAGNRRGNSEAEDRIYPGAAWQTKDVNQTQSTLKAMKINLIKKHISCIHRKAGPCQHHVLASWTASARMPKIRRHKSYNHSSGICIRIPATSSMWFIYVRAHKLHGSDRAKSPLWSQDAMPNGGCKDDRASAIQGSSHLGTSGRRQIGLEDAFSLGWA